MKKKIGIICLILISILISVAGIFLSIPILEKEITDLEQYINAILMFISGVVTLSLITLSLSVFLIKKIKSD